MRDGLEVRLGALNAATLVRFQLSQLAKSPANQCPRGAARSARYPVTVEIVGSNPIEDVQAKLFYKLAWYAKPGKATRFKTS